MLELSPTEMSALILADVEVELGVKARRVLELYRDGHTLRSIAKEQSMSYNQVTKLFTKIKKFVNSEA